MLSLLWRLRCRPIVWVAPGREIPGEATTDIVLLWCFSEFSHEIGVFAVELRVSTAIARAGATSHSSINLITIFTTTLAAASHAIPCHVTCAATNATDDLNSRVMRGEVHNKVTKGTHVCCKIALLGAIPFPRTHIVLQLVRIKRQSENTCDPSCRSSDTPDPHHPEAFRSVEPVRAAGCVCDRCLLRE